MVCRDCHGDGEVECHDCHGDGKVYCPTCKGKGEQKCPDCDGYGKEDCRECNGIGHHSDGSRCHYCINGKVLCNKCRGSGKVPCNKCRGRGKVDCMNCQGDGTVKCSTCRGKGSLICNDCNGHGRTIRYHAVMQEFTFSKRANYFANVDMLNSGEFAESHSKFKGYEVYKETNYDGKISSLKLTSLNSQMGGALEKMLRLEDDALKTIIYQQLSVKRLDAYYFEYSYQSKTYHGVLIGDKFCPGKESPIRECVDNVIDKSKQFMRKRMFPTAYSYLKTACDMNVYGTQRRVHKFYSIVSQKMEELHRLGALISFILMVFIAIPCIYHFYDMYNPVLKFAAYANDPNTLGYESYPAFLTILSMVLLGIMYFYFKDPLFSELYFTTTKFNTMGVLWGFVSFTVIGLLTFAVVGLIMFLGGSLLVEWIFGLLMWLIYLVIFIIFLICKFFSWLWGLIF